MRYLHCANAAELISRSKYAMSELYLDITTYRISKGRYEAYFFLKRVKNFHPLIVKVFFFLRTNQMPFVICLHLYV